MEKVGRTKPVRPTYYVRGNVTRARPSSWRPSLPPASSELAILSSQRYRWRTRGRAIISCRVHGPAGIPPCSPGEGVTPEGRLVLSRRALLSNLSGFLGADGLTHLLYLTPCLVHLLGGPQWWTHFGSIRGTPCSTAATGRKTRYWSMLLAGCHVGGAPRWGLLGGAKDENQTK